MQTFTSKNTSINIKKLPKVFNCLNYEAIPKETIIYDYGSGRYTAHIRAKVESEELEYISYDPFWFPQGEKYRAWGELKEAIRHTKGVIFVCSNVLNVIDNYKEILSICEYAENQALFNNFVFAIYEGDKSGIGRETKKDCYQRNEKLSEYLKFFGHNAIIYKGFITNNKNLIK